MLATPIFIVPPSFFFQIHDTYKHLQCMETELKNRIYRICIGNRSCVGIGRLLVGMYQYSLTTVGTLLYNMETNRQYTERVLCGSCLGHVSI